MDKQHNSTTQHQHTHLFAQPAAAVVILLAIAGIVGALGMFTAPDNELSDAEPERRAAVRIDAATVALTAKAAYVIDLSTGDVLYAKNEEVQLPLASLTKLMSAIVASESLDGDTPVAISAEALAIEGDSGLNVGDRFYTHDLIDLTLLTSSNDGAHALANAAAARGFNERMNSKAEAIDLRQTFFINETGLDTSTSISGGYGSARDVAEILRYIIEHDASLIEATRYGELSFTTLEGGVVRAETTAEAFVDVPGIVGLKTGFTDLAGGNLAVVFDAGLGHPVAAVALGSTREGRFEDIRVLIQASRDAFTEAL